jgi:5-methylcytosine-specific restriction protein A
VRATGPNAATRQLVYERDGFSCCHCGDADGPFQVHHRRPRGLGGSRREDTNSPSNLLLVCERSHREIESKRDVSRAFGFLVRQGDDPATVPVRTVNGWVLLNADGSLQAYREAAS